MWGEDWNWLLGGLIILIAIGYSVQQIDKRVREMKLRADRLSLTFLKIENDLSAIQDSLAIMSRAHGEKISDEVLAIRNRRPAILKFIVSRGPTGADILRGLEFPDFDDDPVFWGSDRMKRLGLENEDDTQ
jgi:hypothetical protein